MPFYSDHPRLEIWPYWHNVQRRKMLHNTIDSPGCRELQRNENTIYRHQSLHTFWRTISKNNRRSLSISRCTWRNGDWQSLNPYTWCIVLSLLESWLSTNQESKSATRVIAGRLSSSSRKPLTRPLWFTKRHSATICYKTPKWTCTAQLNKPLSRTYRIIQRNEIE